MSATMTYGEMRTDEEKEIDTEVVARVKRGIKLLEQTWGPDWVDHVDPAALVMSSASQCVLGQLYDSEVVLSRSDWDNNGYAIGIARLADLQCDGGPEAHGFDADMGVSGVSFPDLQETWVSEIEQRRADRDD